MPKSLRLFVLKHATFLILVAFISIYSLLVLPQLITQNMIGDEGVYILEGDRYVHEFGPNVFYYNSGSPNLLKIITGIALLPLPLDRHYTGYFKENATDVTKASEFTYIQNSAFSQWVLIAARMPHFILALALGILIYLFTNKYIGREEGIIALLLFTFHNTLLAQSGFANLDIGTTFFIFLSFVTFYVFAHISKKEHKKSHFLMLCLVGVTLGLAQGTKISASLLYPTFLLYFLFKKKPIEYLNLLSIFAISVITLWALYAFQIGPALLVSQDPAGIESTYGSIPIVREFKPQITEFLKLPIFPLGAFLNNFPYQLTHQFYGHTMYLNKEFLEHGAWYFIPISFWYKNSLFFIAMIVIAAYYLIRYDKNREVSIYCAVWLLAMSIWAVTSQLQLGTRYIFPLYPQIFILTAAGITLMVKKIFHTVKQQYRAFGTIVLIYCILNVRYYPNNFAFLNITTQGVSPIDLITDSDYDWGQNIYKLRELENKENLKPLYILSYSPANRLYGGDAKNSEFIEAITAKQSGYYAISHSSLVDLKKSNNALFEYFRAQHPVRIIDQNIYIYYEKF